MRDPIDCLWFAVQCALNRSRFSNNSPHWHFTIKRFTGARFPSSSPATTVRDPIDCLWITVQCSLNKSLFANNSPHWHFTIKRFTGARFPSTSSVSSSADVVSTSLAIYVYEKYQNKDWLIDNRIPLSSIENKCTHCYGWSSDILHNNYFEFHFFWSMESLAMGTKIAFCWNLFATNAVYHFSGRHM